MHVFFPNFDVLIHHKQITAKMNQIYENREL